MRILIVEDESRIAKRLTRLTREILADRLTSLKHVNTLQEATLFIEKNELDLLFLDLNLNGEDGFDLLATAVSQSFHTIVVSAYKDQAITAFEYGVLDFVPKPFNKGRLEQALSRLVRAEGPFESVVKYLAIKKRHSLQLIKMDDVMYIKGAGTYTEVFLMDGTKELHDKSLEKLERLLGTAFERIHKSYLVKVSEVQEIIVTSGSKYMAKLKNGNQLPVGRTKYKDLKEKWV